MTMTEGIQEGMVKLRRPQVRRRPLLQPYQKLIQRKNRRRRKKNKIPAVQSEPASATVEPEQDLLGFDDPPSAPTASTSSSEFAAFQASSPPAGASDEFSAFGQMRSAQVQGSDVFASPVASTPAQNQTASFDAFGNNKVNISIDVMKSSVDSMANNTVNNMNNPGLKMNNSAMINGSSSNNDGLKGIGSAFGNMNVGTGLTQQSQQPPMAAANDDDFGDFSDAKADSASLAKTTNSSDPMSKLINLDGLSKNPSKKMTMNQPVVVDAAAAQYQQDIQLGVNSSATPVVVSAGGSDAISSMMGPSAQQLQRGSTVLMNSQDSVSGSMGMPTNSQMQQQFMMSQGMQGNNLNIGAGSTQVQQGMMYGNQMNGGGAMNNINMMGINQMGMNSHLMGGMNQMGGHQQMNPHMMNGMNQMSGQHQMMNSQMMGGMNPMGGQQQMMNPQMMGGVNMQGQQQMR